MSLAFKSDRELYTCPKCGSTVTRKEEHIQFFLTDDKKPEPYTTQNVYVCVNCGTPVFYEPKVMARIK